MIAVNYKLALNVLGAVVFGALFWLTARRGVTDPVCGMKVDRAKALHKDYVGGAVYFCSPGCVEAFENAPARHASAAAR
jgi:YHS domain-containing protein